MINKPLLKGKGLFVFSDPGGARGILSLVHQLKDSLTDVLIVSDREYAFIHEYELPVLLYTQGIEEKIFSEFRPDFLYTGTSYTSFIELVFLSYSFNLSYDILTITFIDHWSNFRSRFIYKEKILFPNYIHVIDTNAYELAIKDGLPENNIYIGGHPYHNYLINWRPSISKNDFLVKYNIDLNKKILLYAPDPLTNVGGIDKYGYDEISALEFLINSINMSNNYENYILIIKPHPNQKIKLINDFLNNRILDRPSIIVKLLEDEVPSNVLIYYSELVFGFFSNLLFEANLIGIKTISLQLGNVFIKLPFHVLQMEIRFSEEIKELLDAN